MPNGRMVSKSISLSEQLAAVSFEADFLFSRCIPHLDRDGRMAGKPELVKSIACPLRPEIEAGAIPDLLRQLGREDLIRWYEAAGKQVLEFPGFAAHQTGFKYDREAPSRYPAFDPATCIDLLRTSSGSSPDLIPIRSAQGK